jgi:hypothetical protein
VLRAAREARGVDAARVERDTKIRARYVEALERGEYRELPGAVYTKGFLRNYGLYLGLDPEYLIDLYRLETRTPSVERPAMPSPPRPIGRRRRGLVVEPGVIVAAILTIVVGGLVAYLGYEFVTFARTPDLRITAPAGDIGAWAGETYTVQGVTARNARVEISGLAENPSVVAGDDGHFEVTVGLVPGSNVMEISAWDPEVSRSRGAVGAGERQVPSPWRQRKLATEHPIGAGGHRQRWWGGNALWRELDCGTARRIGDAEGHWRGRRQ